MKDLLNVFFIILAVMVSRFIPHWPNMTAISASAIWMAYSFPKKNYALFVPTLALLFSDMLLGFHTQMFWVYGAITLSSFLVLKVGSEFSPKSVIQNSLLSSILFFLITNFGVWVSGGFYSYSIPGLAQCFIAGIPFAINDILGTLFYGSLGLMSIQKLDIWVTKSVQI